MGALRSCVATLATIVLPSFMIACKPAATPGPDDPGPRPQHSENVYPLYDMEMSEIARVKGEVGGKVQQLFLVNKSPSSFRFGKPCQGSAVLYHWVESRQVHTYDIRDQMDVSAHLPFHTGINFNAYFDRGQMVRIRVASRGSWVLDTSKLAIPRSCAMEATHFVKTISVGAFKVTTLAKTQVGANAGIASSTLAQFDASKENKTDFEAGDVFQCDDGDAREAPPENCREPVEIMVAPVSDVPTSDDAWAKPGTGEARPTADTTPQPESTCYKAAKRTGDPLADITEIGAKCKSFGLEPVGGAYYTREKTLAEGEGWKALSEISMTAGACYRIFGVGDNGIEDLDIGIKDKDGQQLAADGQHGPIAVINNDGPYCAKKTESVILYVKVEKGRGHYAFWQFRKVR
jgi:hypothetical protein